MHTFTHAMNDAHTTHAHTHTCTTHITHIHHTHTHSPHTLTPADMGCGEVDESYQMYSEQPSINTTNHILEQLDEIDFVMHIGDISYAIGYSSVVGQLRVVASPTCM